MLLQPIEAYRRWAPTYDTAANPVLALEYRALSSLNCESFLDVACGTGRWMRHFAERGAAVFGVDACREMLERSQCNPVVQGDATALPFADGVADLTLCSFAAGYIDDLPSLFREMARATRRGGRVVVSDLHPDALATGWTRSFRDGDTVIEIAHHHRPESEILSAARNAGLRLHRTISASFGEAERPIFRSAGRPMPEIPAIWIGIWKRP
jgi:ubiquinone/menaquinone biosynthesis C-methylase UbiE